jgi:hypothetical protein
MPTSTRVRRLAARISAGRTFLSKGSTHLRQLSRQCSFTPTGSLPASGVSTVFFLGPRSLANITKRGSCASSIRSIRTTPAPAFRRPRLTSTMGTRLLRATASRPIILAQAAIRRSVVARRPPGPQSVPTPTIPTWRTTAYRGHGGQLLPQHLCRRRSA